jgi:hypothetical protein
VDRNELAAELGKLSLWLATLARDHEFTFLDHCIRHGDSLVGLDRRQIEALSWTQQPAVSIDLMQQLLRGRLADAERERDRIRTALDNEPEDQQRLVLQRAEQALADPKLVGDAVIAAFFSAERARAREEERVRIRAAIEQAGTGWQERLKPAVAALRGGTSPVVPFHWPLEFPEVFDCEKPGFDAIVGNPPFADKNTATAVNADHYLDWLQTSHAGAHGNSDIVAHFFRRAYALLRDGGCLGMLATNTIRQGDTRTTGLRPIREAGGTIYTAWRRYKWPGEAAVVVSVVHVAKGGVPGPYHIDGREVPIITAFLFHDGGDDDPRTLRANENKSFIGSQPYGMGFTFDDADTNGVATPLADMRQVIAKNMRNAEVIFPFIGYAEVANDPTHAHRRFIINFGDRSDEECWQQWPDLMQIIENRVKPERNKLRLKNNLIAQKRAEFWWQYGSPAKELYIALKTPKRVLVAGSQASTQYALAFLPTGMVYSSNLTVFTIDTCAGFSMLQSRVHEAWARFFMSTMKDDLAYTPTTCFDPFPFPTDWETSSALEVAGENYHEMRATLMIEYDEGLTKIYNRFHDPDERSNAIGELRRLHDAMDRAVLDAYGWTDIRPTCEFELEWDDDEAENGRRRRKPWRYRWPEPVRDEVLARLLALNAQCAEEERLALGDR